MLVYYHPRTSTFSEMQLSELWGNGTYSKVSCTFTHSYFLETLTSLDPLCMVDHGQGWPASCQREAMAAPTCARALAQEASWARTTPPLFDFSVYRLAIGREGINPWAEQ